jgi:hypothetical protein|tara:strand:- start:346 stop:507 length:162 start_codon:yes stop_codon:yes gene_type:complete
MKEFTDLVSEGVNRMLDKLKMWVADFNDIIEALPAIIKYAAWFVVGYLTCFIF